MPTQYTGDPDNYPEEITLPSDGDAPDAASVNAALEGLADRAAWLAALPMRPGCRLQVANADANSLVPLSDASGATEIGLQPFEHDRIAIWDAAATDPKWVIRQIEAFSSNKLALSGLTSGKNYDVFAYWTGTAVRLELSAAWTDDTTRADALALAASDPNWKGLITKSSDPTRLYVGTIRATGATTTEDSAAKRFVWSAYHRVRRSLRRSEAAGSWTMSAGTLRQANANADNQVEYVAGLGEVEVDASLIGFARNNGGSFGVAIGLDSTTAAATGSHWAGVSNIADAHDYVCSAQYRGTPGAGYHRLVWLERAGSTTATFYGTSSTQESGLVASIQG